MKSIKTTYRKTEIKCINLVATGDTLVVAPKYKKTYTYIFIYNQMIAENIATDKNVRKEVYNLLKESYRENQRGL
jgi:hypothetical protein